MQPARGLDRRRHGPPAGRQPRPRGWSAWTARCCSKMARPTSRSLLRRLSRAVHVPGKLIRARTLLCGEPGSVAGTCWNGSPYQPVPVAEDVPPADGGLDHGAGRGLPVGAGRRRRTCAPTRRRTASTPPTCWATSARSPPRSSTRPRPRTTRRCTAPPSSAGPAWRRSTTATCAGGPATSGSPSTRWAGCSATPARSRAAPGTPWSPRSTPGCRASWRSSSAQTISTARQTFDPVTGRTYVADQGAAVVLNAKNGRVVAMAGAPTYDPKVWVGGITSKQLARLYSKDGGNPLLSRATQGQFAPGSTWKPVMTAGALSNGYSQDTRLNCSSAFQVGNRAFKNYESGAYGYIGFDKALQVSCDTFFYRVGYDFWQQLRHRRRRRERQGPAGVGGEDVRLRQAHRHRHPRRGRRPDRRPQVEAGLLEGQQGLLLQARQEARQRLPAPVRPRVLRRGLRLPRRRRRQLRDRPGRHDGHAAAAGAGLRRARPTAARSGSRASPRRSSTPDGKVVRRIPPEEGVAGQGVARTTSSTSTRRCWAPPNDRHHGAGGSSTSRSTRSRSAPRPGPPRSTASRAPRGSRRTTRSTSC